jgi:hypothetical protein
MTTYIYEVRRDGAVLDTFATEIEAVRYLLWVQPQSMMWACEHEGYAITKQKGQK